MPALSYVTITGTFDDGAGSPLSGTVTFTPNTTVYASGIPVLQPGVPVEAQIVAGELFGPSGGPLTLLATDNSGLSYEGNTGFFFWSVQVTIGTQALGPWEFFLPHEPDVVDLWSLANTVPGAAGILPPAGDIGGTTTAPVVAKIQGTVIEAPPGGTTEYLRGDGTWDVPPGAVSSVFGRSGAVAAESGDYTAAEVGADPSGSAASAQAAAESYAASQASAALSSAETFATSAVATETARAETAEALLAPKASPAFSGAPTAPTASPLTDSTQVATTAYTDAAVAAETSRAETAEALKAPLASPALTGSPTAPTATTGDTSARIATDAFVATAVAAAVAAEASRAETAEGLAALKANNLSDLASAAAARTNLGLGSAATQSASAFDAAGAAAAAQAAAEAASLPALAANVTVSSSATLALNTATEANAASGNLTMTLPAATAGDLIVCEKSDSSVHTVTISGSIRGASSSVTLRLQNESEAFYGYAGSWWPVAGHKTLGSLDTRYGTLFIVPPPTGATATDTPNISAVITALNTAGGNGTLLFQDGTYQVDSNALVIRSCSNFAVRGTGATVITQAPGRSGLPNNTTGDLLVIADSTDFRVSDITLDAQRDTVAPITPLTAAASSGQPSVTVASGSGANYQAGQRLAVFGGLGTTDSNKSDFFADGTTGSSVYVSSVTPGGGASGGDLITFSANLTNSYSQIGGTPFSDGFGPYAWGGAYVTPYQTGYQNSVAGRSLTGEDQQNNLHLLNCQRFAVSRVTSRNCWESPVKCGSGNSSTQLADACSDATITDCTAYHGYDQGVSLWLCSGITVKGCVCIAAGWAGISLTASDECTVTGCIIDSSYYRIPSDNGSGCGIAIEGGVSNTVTGCRVQNTYSDAVRLTSSPIAFGAGGGSAPTLGAFTAAATAAGASIQVSSSASLQVNGRYSIQDGQFSEPVTVSSVVDGTHVTFSAPTVYSHKSGVYISNRIGCGNILAGNVLYEPQNGSGFNVSGHVRDIIKGNTIYGVSGGNGIALTYSEQGSGAYTGGDGSLVEGNSITANTGGPGIATDSVAGLQICGNRITGQSTQPAISAKGLTDAQVCGNFVSDTTAAAGIFLQNGTLSGTVCSKVTISGNVVQRLSNEGIIILNGDSLTITGNVATSCGGNAGINPRGVTRSEISGNICNANHGAGIQLDNNGSNYCLYNQVTGNTCRDDGSGYNVTTGASWTSAYGIRETGNSDYNVFEFNEMDTSSSQLTITGTHSAARRNSISGSLLPPAVTTPGVPATTVAQQNATGHDVFAYIAGGTVTAITVGSTATGITTGMVFVPAGQTITLTYSAAPTWTWIAAG
jgi:parallel beta-helix repeat protein